MLSEVINDLEIPDELIMFVLNETDFVNCTLKAIDKVLKVGGVFV